MGEANGNLRAILIQSRSGLSAVAREMKDRGMISEETLARILQTASQGSGESGGQPKVRVI